MTPIYRIIQGYFPGLSCRFFGNIRKYSFLLCWLIVMKSGNNMFHFLHLAWIIPLPWMTFFINNQDIILERENIFTCVRELQTIKIYTPQEIQQHKKNNEFFHSFTNPIWLKTGLITTIPKTSDPTISFYPNPVKDILHIVTSYDPPISFTISDLTGKINNW